MDEGQVGVVIMTLIIVAGVGLMVAAMMNRRRFRELEHEERLAMIEKGLLPSPESNPAGFEAGAKLPPIEREPGVRYRTAGVMMLGLGLGLAMLLTFTANSPDVGLGVGGGAAMLGAASLLNYFLIAKGRETRRDMRRWTPGATPRSPEPPGTTLP